MSREMTNVVHGDARNGKIAPEYSTWQHMRSRCFVPGDPAYKYYGGRGITVCDAWRHDYLAFLSCVGRKPSPCHTLDRIDNNGNYEPGNVRWATPTMQSRNSRGNRIVEINGESMCITEWSERSGTPRDSIQRRLEAGWSPEKAVFTAGDGRFRNHEITINGESCSAMEWGRRTGQNGRTIMSRISKLGWTPEEAVLGCRRRSRATALAAGQKEGK